MEGTIVFLKIFVGTKSESLQPHLYLGEGKMIRLRKEGDNPFDNESLWPFDGKKVRVQGKVNEEGILYVESLEIEDSELTVYDEIEQ